MFVVFLILTCQIVIYLFDNTTQRLKDRNHVPIY